MPLAEFVLSWERNRTMSLNSHYLVLFKHPRDQQQVMTLARQMYPGNSQHFMDHYKAATDKPYGYLVIDLKPNTSDDQRLRANVLENIPTINREHKKTEITDNSHLYPNNEGVNTSGVISVPDSETKMEEMDAKCYSCDDCGILFDDMHDLQRHIRTWCPESSPSKRPRLNGNGERNGQRPNGNGERNGERKLLPKWTSFYRNGESEEESDR